MTQINLLPWREERRETLKKQFFIVLGAMAVLGAGIVFLVNLLVQSQVEWQQARNNFITEETKVLDEKIAELKELRENRERLIGRMEKIQQLQGDRPVIVHVFDEIARTLPTGVYYKELKSQGDLYTAEGVAETNKRVSGLMRSLTASSYFKDPNLANVRNIGEKEDGGNVFSLTMKLETPNPEALETPNPEALETPKSETLETPKSETLETPKSKAVQGDS